MRKKSLLRLKNGRIFYISLSLKMFKKCIGVTRQRRKRFLSLLRLCFFVLWTLWIWYYILKTYLRGKNCFSKMLEGFKTQKSPSKVEKYQNNLHLIELENVKKCIGVTCQRRKYLLCVLRFYFLFYRLLVYHTTFQKQVFRFQIF